MTQANRFNSWKYRDTFRKEYRERTGYYFYTMPSGKLGARKMPKRAKKS